MICSQKQVTWMLLLWSKIIDKLLLFYTSCRETVMPRRFYLFTDTFPKFDPPGVKDNNKTTTVSNLGNPNLPLYMKTIIAL